MNRYESKNPNVNPSHYKKGGLEVIDVIKAFTADLTGIKAICAGNAIKYILRFNHKNGVEDLEKAIWYEQRLIEEIKAEQDGNIKEMHFADNEKIE